MNRKAAHAKYMAELYQLEHGYRQRSWSSAVALAFVWLGLIVLVGGWLLLVGWAGIWAGQSIGRLMGW